MAGPYTIHVTQGNTSNKVQPSDGSNFVGQVTVIDKPAMRTKRQQVFQAVDSLDDEEFPPAEAGFSQHSLHVKITGDGVEFLLAEYDIRWSIPAKGTWEVMAPILRRKFRDIGFEDLS